MRAKNEKKKLMQMQFKIKFYRRKSFSAHLIPIPIQTKLTYEHLKDSGDE